MRRGSSEEAAAVPLLRWALAPAGAGEGEAGTGDSAHTQEERLVDSSHAQDRRMIALVRERPLLYTRSTLPVASYYGKTKRLWQEVADIMGWTVAEVRRKWSHVRNSYSRHLRNCSAGARTGRGRAVSRWYLAAELDFLRRHMATDMKEPPLSPPPEDCPERGGDEGYFHFFRGLYCDYRELPPAKQRMFRRKCVLLLHELVEGETHGGAGEGGGGEGQWDSLHEAGAGEGAGEGEEGWGAAEEPAFVSVKLEPPDAADT